MEQQSSVCYQIARASILKDRIQLEQLIHLFCPGSPDSSHESIFTNVFNYINNFVRDF